MSKLLLGADEVSVGSLAGPLIVVCASATEDMHLMRARDSKKYGKNVNRLWGDIRQSVKYSLGYGMCTIDAPTLCKMGYSRAISYGFNQAVAKLRRRLAPRYPRVIIDGILDHDVPFSEAVIKADDKYKVVSLASCIAKANQIACMEKIHLLYPEYRFNSSHGYGTKFHIQALKDYGVIIGIHRVPVVVKMFKKNGWKLKTYTGENLDG